MVWYSEFQYIWYSRPGLVTNKTWCSEGATKCLQIKLPENQELRRKLLNTWRVIDAMKLSVDDNHHEHALTVTGGQFKIKKLQKHFTWKLNKDNILFMKVYCTACFIPLALVNWLWCRSRVVNLWLKNWGFGFSPACPCVKMSLNTKPHVVWWL